MRFEIGYGEGTQHLMVPDANLAGVVEANAIPDGPRGEEAVIRALRSPIGSPPLGACARGGDRVAVIVSDISRPVPTRVLLPPVLDELWRAGVRSDRVTVVFALGSHRRHTREEMARLVGDDVFGRVRCLDGDPGDCVRLGVTSRGTPVDVVRAVAEADFKIGTGNIEYHYFAGYSGGAKAIMPGVSSLEAVQANHRRMTEPGAEAGRLDGNPVREDIEEAGRISGLGFIVNVVLDGNKEIVRAVAGHPSQAHRKGCRFLDSMYCAPVSAPADIVIASPGGLPKDRDLYQTQKALENAKFAAKKGGVIILVGSCREGFGDATFAAWLREAVRPEALVERVRRDFRLGGHKAAAIAMVLASNPVYLVSDLPADQVRDAFMRPFSDLQAAYAAAVEQIGPDASVLVMPNAGSTLPRVIASAPAL